MAAGSETLRMLLLANTLIASMMFSAGCALLTAILLRRTYRTLGRGRRRVDNAPIAAQPRPTHAWSGAYTDSAALIERHKVELHELGRDLKAQLDNKIIILQELCAKSQQQIDRMESLLKELDSQSPARN